jgi:predicted MFS family arabinose efflux permease
MVFGGLMTELDWRATFFLPVPVALGLLFAAPRYLRPDPRGSERVRWHHFDLAGAVTVTAAMLLFVYTVVSAPTEGWGSPRTLGSFAVVAVLLAAFVAIELRVKTPLVRLGIFRSASLRRANLSAMAIIGGWFGVQFIATLYMQQMRGWSPLETALAFLPAGVLVTFGAPRAGAVIARFGIPRTLGASMLSFLIAYALFAGIGADSNYFLGILPTMLFAGLGFALGYGPVNVAATAGVADHEQGLASGLVTASFQIGGAIALAIVTAVIAATAGGSTDPASLLNAYQAGIVVSVIVVALGLLMTVGGVVLDRRALSVAAAEA